MVPSENCQFTLAMGGLASEEGVVVVVVGSAGSDSSPPVKKEVTVVQGFSTARGGVVLGPFRISYVRFDIILSYLRFLHVSLLGRNRAKPQRFQEKIRTVAP